MDFIFFKFIYGKHGKNLMIRRRDVTLKYLRRQVRQLYRMTEGQKFAITYELLNDSENTFKSRHFYCSRPHEKPDKVSFFNFMKIFYIKAPNHSKPFLILNKI